jgi:hypothetical protein
MRFVWFWTFWHWSTESFRDGSLLRSPLHGIGSHWDEWYCHEASVGERAAVQQAGRTRHSQRQFIAWLLNRWAREANLRKNGLARHFILSELAGVAPFNEWAAFEKYRASFGVGGLSAIILTEKSLGEAEDVRRVEAIALPADATAPQIVSEGFQVDGVELEIPRRAAMSLLNGKGLLVFLALWIASGRRPYSKVVRVALMAGWFGVAGIILYLLIGPDPGRQLFYVVAALVTLWVGLIAIAAKVSMTQCLAAWRDGREWNALLNRSQVRLRMNGGLTLKGGSAGVVFCLSTMLSLFRAKRGKEDRSWLWRNIFTKLNSETNGWAATGVVTAEAHLRPVVIEPKLRACVQHDSITHLLMPRQSGAGRGKMKDLSGTLASAVFERTPVTAADGLQQLGFAAESQGLAIHRCRHVAGALMRLGNLLSARQMAVNVLALAVSCVILFGNGGLRAILFPPRAPLAVAPSSPSPSYLWVSLDTRHPQDFRVVLESQFWSNRRANLIPRRGPNALPRAEMRLAPLATPASLDSENGTVWVERRNHFLTREFDFGERVGCYSLTYLNRLGHE